MKLFCTIGAALLVLIAFADAKEMSAGGATNELAPVDSLNRFRGKARVGGTCKLIKYNNIEAAWCDPEHKATFNNDDAGWTKAMADVETAAKGFYSAKPYAKGQLTGVQIVFSFGAADKAGVEARTGFDRIMALTDAFGASKKCYGTGKASDIDNNAVQKDDDDKYLGARFYVDAKALKTLPGGWWKPQPTGTTEATPGPYSLSLYWQEYYKEAMETASVMVFLLTEGWFASKWCGEELTWATGAESFKRIGKKNVVVLLDAVAKEKIATNVGGENKSTMAKWAKVLGLADGATKEQVLAATIDLSADGSTTVNPTRITTIKTKIDEKLAA